MALIDATDREDRHTAAWRRGTAQESARHAGEFGVCGGTRQVGTSVFFGLFFMVSGMRGGGEGVAAVRNCLEARACARAGARGE